VIKTYLLLHEVEHFPVAGVDDTRLASGRSVKVVEELLAHLMRSHKCTLALAAVRHQW
jgi:hypothetical protein